MIATLEPRTLLADPTIQVTFGSGLGPIALSAYHGESLSYAEYSLVNGEDPDGTNRWYP